MVKNRPHQLFQQLAGELVMQAEFYFTGFVAQWDEAPASVQVLERAVCQGHVDLARGRAQVLGTEMLLDMVIVDMQRGMHHIPFHIVDSRPAAPWQELRVLLYPVQQVEHLLRRVRNQYGLLYQSHCFTEPPNQRLVEYRNTL